VCKLVQELRDFCPADVSLCLFPQDNHHVLRDSDLSLSLVFRVLETSWARIPGTPATGERKKGVKVQKMNYSICPSELRQINRQIFMFYTWGL